eukprot:1376378-Amorphochlora_amoeboformis.AAC.1
MITQTVTRLPTCTNERLSRQSLRVRLTSRLLVFGDTSMRKPWKLSDSQPPRFSPHYSAGIPGNSLGNPDY